MIHERLLNIGYNEQKNKLREIITKRLMRLKPIQRETLGTSLSSYSYTTSNDLLLSSIKQSSTQLRPA